MRAAWIEGARFRTLPAAAAPVFVGTSAAFYLGAWSPIRALLALLVALALQVGVNYANDYSDGIRGTDDDRVGPPRLTGGGIAAPRSVLMAALACFMLAGIAGLVLLWLSGQWWLICAGLAAIAAAWFYTGGKNPYGYMGVGLSEIMVFIFFGLMACVGTTWVQALRAPWWVWVCGACLGLLSVAMLIVNNLRDIDGDKASGKRTLVVRMGRQWSLRAFAVCVLMPVIGLVIITVITGLGGSGLAFHSNGSWVFVGCAFIALFLWLAFALMPVVRAYRACEAGQWIHSLKLTGFAMLLWAFVASAQMLCS
ncbi:1,4-dihydroxy-2-naphthoate polyprenyltransferase [Schaalia sp. lx-100]|nr:1,4-dihydroxy-2-naphthoate polyprenyltransferase [Schaalia sp. lx-260]MCD4557525.1 1,4-dihydroxy-2-naphthoate polyprenyltransferase [Schaalia sp. lx-100]